MQNRLYIAVLDEFPDYMTPTLVAHSILGAHLAFEEFVDYQTWLTTSFKKCVVRVNEKEFSKILELEKIYVGRENNTLNKKDSCIVVCPQDPTLPLPNVLKFAKLWKPK